jgi:hypothetical protein
MGPLYCPLEDGWRDDHAAEASVDSGCLLSTLATLNV